VQRITYHMKEPVCKELVQTFFTAQHTKLKCKSIHMSVVSLIIHWKYKDDTSVCYLKKKTLIPA